MINKRASRRTNGAPGGLTVWILVGELKVELLSAGDGVIRPRSRFHRTGRKSKRMCI